MTEQLYKTTRTTVTKYLDGEISEVTETEVIEPYFASGGTLFPNTPFITYGSGSGYLTTGTTGVDGIQPVNHEGVALSDERQGNTVINISAPTETDLETLAKMVSREGTFWEKDNTNSTKGNTNDIS